MTQRAIRQTALALCACLIGSSARAGTARPVKITVDANRVVHTTERHRLLGSNLALWHEASQMFNPDLQQYMRDLHPAYLRIPGGSWSDEYYWNGHGVWKDGVFDLSRLKDGYWDVDFSAYAPGFRVHGLDRKPADYHGNVDVKALHELIVLEGAEPIVTVNAGTGKPELAAEWVRWANKINSYNVRHWEIGNELEGNWELGHVRPDGSRMTGETYARIFTEHAQAMKAVDPTILVGGPAAANSSGGFLPDLLRLAGNQVDFVTFHTYPVERQLESESDMFAQMLSLREAMANIRAWLERYVPERKDKIEIGITEWNSKVVEDRDTADLLNGLWTAAWIGEMFQAGVSFATQWDLLTATKTGGHGLFLFVDGQCIPRSQFWGLYLWSKFMGNELLAATVESETDAFAFATRSDGVLSLLIVNPSREQTLDVELVVTGAELESYSTVAELSHREYFWNPYTHRPERSQAPALRATRGASPLRQQVAPFSASVIRIPTRGTTDALAATARPARGQGIELILPPSAPGDLPVEGWVLTDASIAAGEPAHLNVEGPARLDRASVGVGEGAGRFYLQPTGVGEVTVTAGIGAKSTRHSLTISPVVERHEIVWDFERDHESQGVTSSYPWAPDDSMRPNQRVAAVRLDAIRPTQGTDTLIAFEKIPEGVRKEQVGGVVFDLYVGEDFACEDAEVGLSIILQSESAHWMPLLKVPLLKVQPGWNTYVARVEDPNLYRAMPKLYTVRFQLFQKGQDKVPVSGTVYVDRVGFLYRSAEGSEAASVGGASHP